MSSRKVSYEHDLSSRKPPYSRGNAFLIWCVLLTSVFCSTVYLISLSILITEPLIQGNQTTCLLSALVSIAILLYVFPRYVKRNVVGYYVYINMRKSNGGDRLECQVGPKPMHGYPCIIRLPIGGWFRRAAVIKAPCDVANNVWRVKVLGDLYPLGYTALQWTDCDKRPTTSYDPEMIYHILSHPNVWRAMESLKNSRRQEREGVGSWLQIYHTLQKSRDALCSPYVQFFMLYAEAVLIRRFGSRADLRELAIIDYPDETASWSTVVDKHGYLLSAQGRRAHEAAKAAARSAS